MKGVSDVPTRKLLFEVNRERYSVNDVIRYYEDPNALYQMMKIIGMGKDELTGEDFVFFRKANKAIFPEKLEFVIQKIKNQIYLKVETPIYQLEQRFKNKYTHETIRVVAISPRKDDTTKQFHYFVEQYTSTAGLTYRTMTEIELLDFYKQEGVEKITW